MARLSNPSRRGMILLLVLSMLAMFALMIVTFMLATSHLRRTSEAIGSRPPVGLVQQDYDAAKEAANILLTGADPVARPTSVLVHHSILENLYGHPKSGSNDAFEFVFAYSNDFKETNTTPNLLVADPDDLFGSISLLDGLNNYNDMKGVSVNLARGDLMGSVLTVKKINESAVPWTQMNKLQRIAYEEFLLNKSFRIAYHGQSGWAAPELFQSIKANSTAIATDGFLNADCVVLAETESSSFTIPQILTNWSFARLLENCTIVVNGAPFSGTGPGYDFGADFSDTAMTLEDEDGIAYFLRPNPAAPDENRDSNNDYNTYRKALYNNFVPMNPDYTAPDLKTLFLGWLDMGQGGAGTVQDIIPSFHRPQLVDYWNNHNSISMDANLLRKIVLRPLPLDHPAFSGSNPMLELDVLKNDGGDTSDDAAAEMADRMAVGPLNTLYDVDNDGDTIPDGYWMDIGMNVIEDSSTGQKYKPLASFFIIDMDGRVNLNAHGSWVEDTQNYHAASGPMDVDYGNDYTLSRNTDYRGEGMGPAEVRLDKALRAIGITDIKVLQNIFGANQTSNGIAKNSSEQFGRYGRDDSPPFYSPAPGTPQQYTEKSIFSLREHPWDGAIGSYYTSYAGAIPDLYGFGTISCDVLGNRLYMNAAPFDYGTETTPGMWGVKATTTNMYTRDNGTDPGLPTLFDNPYLFDPNGTGTQVDQPFTASELESLLRVRDYDLSALPPRLLALLTDKPDRNIGNNTGDLQRLRRMSRYLTTASNDIPSPAGFYGPDAPGLFSQVLKCAGGNSTVAQTILAKLPPEIFEGRRIDLNRLSKDPDVVSPADDVAYRRGLKKRAKFAEEIFMLLMVLSYDQLYGYGNNTAYVESGLGSDPTLTTPDLKRQWMITRLAQWSVNLVDYLDPDDASTPLVFDLDPFNTPSTWKSIVVDQDIDTINFINETSNTLSAVKSGTSSSRSINLVWGMERSNILISETMALHNRRVADTDQEPGENDGEKGKTTILPPDAQPEDEPDDDYDQVYPPQASLFVELYNASDPNRPDYVRNEGVSLVRNGLSVYRLVVGAKTFDNKYKEGDNKNKNNIAIRAGNQPRTFSFQPRQDSQDTMFRSHVLGPSVLSGSEEIDIDRIIWFHSAPNASIEDANLAAYSYWNSNMASGNTDLGPNQYLVIGPREVTYLASQSELAGPPPSPADAEAKGHPAQTIRLKPELLNVRNAAGEYDSLSDAGYRQAKVLIATSNANDVGVNISGPGSGESGYYKPALGALDPDAEEGTEQKMSPVQDEPFDMQAGNPVADDGIYGTGTVPSYKPLFLQRLADPNRAYHSVTNPYITVDWTMIDLVVYSGEESTKNSGNGAAGEMQDDERRAYQLQNNETLRASTPIFASRQICIDHCGSSKERNPWSRISLLTNWDKAPDNKGDNPDTVSSVISAQNMDPGNNCTFGFLNYSEDEKEDDGEKLRPWASNDPINDFYAGCPCLSANDKVPFLVYPWNDAPFASSYDAMHVPASAPGRFGVEYMASVTSGLDPYVAGGSLGVTAYHPHLLNFFYGPSLVTGDPPQYASLDLVRFFNYVGIPSRFAGTVVPVVGNSSGNIEGGIYTYREPGRINVNTMSDIAWSALAAARDGDYPKNFNKIENSRRITSLTTSDMEIFAQPFRSGMTPAMVAHTALMPHGGTVDTTLFRRVNNLSGSPNDTDSLFAFKSSDSPDRTFNTKNQFDRLTRLAEMTTTRSNVFAVWMTVGFFEVKHYANHGDFRSDYTTGDYPTTTHINANNFSAIFPDGYVLGRERGGTGGAAELKRLRVFMLVDRSKAAGFRRGEPLNAFDNTVQLFRTVNY